MDAAIRFASRRGDAAAGRLASRIRRQLVDSGYGPTICGLVRQLAPACNRQELRRAEKLIGLASCNSRPTVLALTDSPCPDNSSARVRVLLHVQRSGDIGSPRVPESTKRSIDSITCGCSDSRRFRPAPGRRSCQGGSESGLSSSLIPFRIVRSDIPVAAATASMPPQPSDRASAAPHRLRARSSRSAAIAAYFCRIHSTTCASGMAGTISKSSPYVNTNFGNSFLSAALMSMGSPESVGAPESVSGLWSRTGRR